MINRQDLSKIGIGTWGVGGYMERDNSVDEQKQVKAIAYMLNKGINLVEANDWYSQGYAVEILAKAIRESSVKREDIFVVQAVYLKNNTLNDVEAEVDKVMRILGTDYIDSLQFTSGVFLQYGFEEACEVIQKLLDSGKVRYTSITNENLDLLKKYHSKFGEKLFSHEVCYNFEVRVNETEGTIPYANENKILTVIYQPLRRNRTAGRNWPLLVELSKKYGKTQNQIVLSWLISKGYVPLTKSETLEHIDEHLEATTITIEADDLARMDNFTPPRYEPPVIDWNKSGVGVSVDQLSNVFDDDYDKQTKKT